MRFEGRESISEKDAVDGVRTGWRGSRSSRGESPDCHVGPSGTGSVSGDRICCYHFIVLQFQGFRIKEFLIRSFDSAV